jgi:ubiquinone/menaquinone biosynthesis C-methylase UbiE
MPDVYATIAEQDAATQERLIGVLETRGADPQQQSMRRAFLGDIAFGSDARVLDVGCGTGVLSRVLAAWPGVREVTGVDPGAVFVAKARELAASFPNLSIEEADGRQLPFPADSYDVVTIDSTLSHMTGPDHCIAEAFRVLRAGGQIAIFDGDYATTTVALSEGDPLQACVNKMMSHSVTDRWVVRRLSSLVRDAGFVDARFRSYGFVETEGGYMRTIVERGTDMLAQAGEIGPDTAAALKQEVTRRIEEGRFFGHIAYGSVIARKP